MLGCVAPKGHFFEPRLLNQGCIFGRNSYFSSEAFNQWTPPSKNCIWGLNHCMFSENFSYQRKIWTKILENHVIMGSWWGNCLQPRTNFSSAKSIWSEIAAARPPNPAKICCKRPKDIGHHDKVQVMSARVTCPISAFQLWPSTRHLMTNVNIFTIRQEHLAAYGICAPINVVMKNCRIIIIWSVKMCSNVLNAFKLRSTIANTRL